MVSEPQGGGLSRLAGMNRKQTIALIIAAANIVLILLFPPFESVYAITKASIPTFEGFYFIFARQPNHVIVTTILYLEVFFVLINGALFWLIFREIKYASLAPADALKIVTEARKRRG